MKVNKSKALTPDEELDLIREQIRNVPDFIIWEVHPNVVRTTKMYMDKLTARLNKLIVSAEFLEYNPL